MCLYGQRRQRGRAIRRVWMLLFIMLPLLGGSSCDSGDRMDEIRTAVAPGVASLISALGDLLGEAASSAVTPLPGGDPG